MALEPDFHFKPEVELYNLIQDPGETTNLYFKQSQKREELQALLEELKSSGRSAPKGRVPVGIDNIPRLASGQN